MFTSMSTFARWSIVIVHTHTRAHVHYRYDDAISNAEINKKTTMTKQQSCLIKRRSIHADTINLEMREREKKENLCSSFSYVNRMFYTNIYVSTSTDERGLTKASDVVAFFFYQRTKEKKQRESYRRD